MSDVTTELAMESNDKTMEIARLKAENAKLRRLAHDALLYGNERSYGESLYKLKEMARDLGVEVDA